MKHSAPSAERFLTLDLLRGIAALAVALRHLPTAPTKDILPGSYLAVDLFFALSGFVLAHAYLKRLADGMKLSQFLAIRATRLYPLYGLATLIGAAAALPLAIRSMAQGGLLHWFTSLIVNLLCLPVPKGWGVNSVHPFPFVFPAWSLFWELAVNVLFVLLALRLGRFGKLALLGAGTALLILSGWHYGSLDTGSNYGNFPGGGLRVIFSFFAGVALYQVWRSGKLNRLHAALGGFAAPLAIALMMAAFAIDPGAHRALFDCCVALVVFPALIAIATGPMLPLFNKTATVLGTASYPLYVLHAPLFKMISHTGEASGLPASSFGPAVFSLSILVIFLISVGPAQWFDRWARSLMQRAMRRTPKPATA